MTAADTFFARSQSRGAPALRRPAPARHGPAAGSAAGRFRADCLPHDQQESGRE